MMDVLSKILAYRDLHKLSDAALARVLGVDRSLPGKWARGKAYPSRNDFPRFAKAIGITLEELLNSKDQENLTRVGESGEVKTDKLIPLYDVVAVGGTSILADTGAVSEPTDWVYPGSWFNDAVAAVKVYGDSMWPMYPNGCMVTCREVKNRNLLIWGQVYVIETSEYRVIKKVQKGDHNDHIRGDSQNSVKNHQGKEIHESMDIPWSEIRRIFLVLGMAHRVQA